MKRCFHRPFALFFSGLVFSCSSSVDNIHAATTANYLPVRTVLPDGTVVSKLPGDASVTRKPNGGLTTKVRGTTFTVYPDGTTFTELPGGGGTTTQPNGKTSTRLPDGTKVDRGADGKITTQLPLGGRVTVSPGGTKYIEHSDGTTVEIFPDGGTKTRKALDMEIFTKPDGTTTIFWIGYTGGVTSFQTQFKNGRWRCVIYFDGINPKDLKTISVEADGAITTEFSNGNKFTILPDGRQSTNSPPALQVAPLQQQRPATGTLVIPGPITPGTTITKSALPAKPGVVPLAPGAQKPPGASGGGARQ